MADETVSTPQEVLDRVPECLEAFKMAGERLADSTAPALMRALLESAQEGANEIRTLLPHLDDATLVVLAGYISAVAGQIYETTGSQDMMSLFYSYAMIGQQFGEFL